MKRFRTLIAAAGLAVLATPALADNLWGTYDGTRYDLTFDGGNLWGSYGDGRVDIYANGTNLWGDLFGTRIDVYANGGNIWGTFPCGQRSDYYVNGTNVWGTNCGERFDLYYGDAAEAREAAEDLLVDAVADEFPQPVKARVRTFVRSILR